MVANNNSIPPSGTGSGFRRGRNPTLIPNFDKPTVGAGQAGGNQNPADFLAANPRVDATATATIGGSATSGDILTIEYTNPVLASLGVANNRIAASVTVGGSDTLFSIAEAFASAFNDLAQSEQIDLRADAALAVVTFRHSGPIGNFGVLTKALEQITITMGGTAHTGDRASVLFTGPGLGANGVLIQTSPTTGQTATQMGDALVAAIAANSTLAGLSIVGVNTTGAVALTLPAGDYNVTSWVNTITPTDTIGGTPDPADVLTLTFTNTGLPGGSRVVSYTTLLTDTTTALAAAGLNAAINADPVLGSAGITSTLLGSIITIAYPQAIGQLRFSQTASGTLTQTLTAAPTTTAVASTTDSETITFSNSGKLSGGSGPIICSGNFDFANAGQAQSFFYGQPYVVDYTYLNALLNAGVTIV